MSKWPSWAPRPNEPNYGFCGRKATSNHAYIGTGHSLSLICQPTSEDMKLYIIIASKHQIKHEERPPRVQN